MNNNQITEFKLSNIVDPSIQTISLLSVKELHKKQMQGYDDVIERLQAQLNEAQELIEVTELRAKAIQLETDEKMRYLASYKNVYDQVSFRCPFDYYSTSTITIFQCGERIRQGKCKAGHRAKRTEVCRERQAILKKIGAQEA